MGWSNLTWIVMIIILPHPTKKEVTTLVRTPPPPPPLLGVLLCIFDFFSSNHSALWRKWWNSFSLATLASLYWSSSTDLLTPTFLSVITPTLNKWTSQPSGKKPCWWSCFTSWWSGRALIIFWASCRSLYSSLMMASMMSHLVKKLVS